MNQPAESQPPHDAALSPADGPGMEAANPFARPLDSGLATPERAFASRQASSLRPMQPTRRTIAKAYLQPAALMMVVINASWCFFLLLGIVVVSLEQATGASFGVVGWVFEQVSAPLEYLGDFRWLYPPITFGFSLLGVTGAIHAIRLQSIGLARAGAIFTCLPLLGAWLGLAAPISLLLWMRLRRSGIEHAFRG